MVVVEFYRGLTSKYRTNTGVEKFDYTKSRVISQGITNMVEATYLLGYLFSLFSVNGNLVCLHTPQGLVSIVCAACTNPTYSHLVYGTLALESFVRDGLNAAA